MPLSPRPLSPHVLSPHVLSPRGPAGALALLLGACAPAGKGAPAGPAAGADSAAPDPDSAAVDLGPPQPPAGRLKIEEVSYSGAHTPDDPHLHYFHDQFYDLRNDSDAPVQLDGLCLGDALGNPGEVNPGMAPAAFAEVFPEAAVLGNVWCLPNGGAGLRLAPGATLLIAQDGFNHRPYSTVDLSGADFEAFVDLYPGRDDDSPTAENLDRVLYTAGYDWLVTVFGPSIVVFVMPGGAELEQIDVRGTPAAVVPAAQVVDAMNSVMDADSVDYRRLPPTVDAGVAWVSGTYTGESLRRRRGADGRLIDTDDSGADFEVAAAPAPGE